MYKYIGSAPPKGLAPPPTASHGSAPVLFLSDLTDLSDLLIVKTLNSAPIIDRIEEISVNCEIKRQSLMVSIKKLNGLGF